jgi:hypothetical protein
MTVGLGLLVYNGLMAPTNHMVFEGVTILISFAATTAIIAIAAIWFPATGEAAERASKFFATLRRPSIATEASVTSPIPISGIVIGTMGLALVIVALGVFPTTKLNLITLGMGVIFNVIGLGMVLPEWLARRRRPPVETALPASIGRGK